MSHTRCDRVSDLVTLAVNAILQLIAESYPTRDMPSLLTVRPWVVVTRTDQAMGHDGLSCARESPSRRRRRWQAKRNGKSKSKGKGKG
ncbi:MAG: hypothetical protein IJ131_05790 [Eggerthellaceae bacterium]|nr:hypothetical protein [Eggerthellaceae bacterium]